MDSIHLDSNLGHWMTHRPQPKENPFRIGGVVSGPFFADREDERKRIRQALVTPQEHLLVYGPRRMGKTSMLRVVQETLRHGGHPVILADLSTASSLSEMTTRLLQAATRELGRKWRDVAAAFAERLRIKLTLEPDPATGLLLPSLGVGLADADVGAQRQTFGDVLDAIDALASAPSRRNGSRPGSRSGSRRWDCQPTAPAPRSSRRRGRERATSSSSPTRSPTCGMTRSA